MLCGVCLQDVEVTVMGEYSGLLLCEECYWEEIVTEEAFAADSCFEGVMTIEENEDGG